MQIGGAHEVRGTCLHREALSEGESNGRATLELQIGGAHDLKSTYRKTPGDFPPGVSPPNIMTEAPSHMLRVLLFAGPLSLHAKWDGRCRDTPLRESCGWALR